MAKNAKATEAKPEEKKEEKATPPVAKAEKGLLSILRSEILDNILLGILLLFGYKHQSDSNIGSGGGSREKQTPSWLIQAFPTLTRDDDNEYNLGLDSHPEKKAATAARKFKTALSKEGIYDDIQYIVNLIMLRREMMERSKNPLPEDKSGGRVTYETLSLKDPFNAFLTELLEEETTGGSEMFERQKERAIERNLLSKKHWFKKILENKTDSIFILIAIVLALLVIIAGAATLA